MNDAMNVILSNGVSMPFVGLGIYQIYVMISIRLISLSMRSLIIQTIYQM